MAPLTHDRHTPFIEHLTQVAWPVAGNTTIYKNSLVCRNAQGAAVPASNNAGFVVIGVSVGDAHSIRRASAVINESNEAGAANVLVRRNGSYLFNSKSVLAPGDIGKPLYVFDDQTVTLDATEGNNVLAGVLARFESPTEAWLDIYPATAAGFFYTPPATP